MPSISRGLAASVANDLDRADHPRYIESPIALSANTGLPEKRIVEF
jgi:hypothetical protein